MEIFFFILKVIIACLLLFCILIMIKVLQLKLQKKKVTAEKKSAFISRLQSPGFADTLSVLPLVDYYSDNPRMITEPGVSYLVRTDKTSMLLDLGFNSKNCHPSPLLHNMAEAKISPSDIDTIFISHLHMDHIGGMAQQRKKTFSLSAGKADIAKAVVYAPGRISASENNPVKEIIAVNDPVVIGKGVASTGAIPRALFLAGIVREQSLVINVKGKGLVLLIGCGHQSIQSILERVQCLYDDPVYAIIGGLHLPVRGGRPVFGFINIQHIVGSDRPPWNGVNEKDVEEAIKAIKKVDPEIVSLSPHDSSDWTIQQFMNAFGKKYTELKAGKEIIIK